MRLTDSVVQLLKIFTRKHFSNRGVYFSNIFLANMAEIYHLCRVIFKPLKLAYDTVCKKNPAERQGFRLLVHALAWVYTTTGSFN